MDEIITNLVNILFLDTFYLCIYSRMRYGVTIGKMVLKIKIIKEDGGKVTYKDVLIRELASYISAIVWFLGYLWVLWDKRKQAWHDKLMHTLVVVV